jgi:hypothetical protein
MFYLAEMFWPVLLLSAVIGLAVGWMTAAK